MTKWVHPELRLSSFVIFFYCNYDCFPGRAGFERGMANDFFIWRFEQYTPCLWIQLVTCSSFIWSINDSKRFPHYSNNIRGLRAQYRDVIYTGRPLPLIGHYNFLSQAFRPIFRAECKVEQVCLTVSWQRQKQKIYVITCNKSVLLFLGNDTKEIFIWSPIAAVTVLWCK